MTESEKQQALDNFTPRTPQRTELGGDYYYRCYWLGCNAEIKKYWNYCPICGGRIDWEGVV